MCFRNECMDSRFPVVIIAFFLMNILSGSFSAISNGVSGTDDANGTIFQYQDINQCKRNEFYDLNYFACIACNTDDEHLQPTDNKFACQCAANTVTVVLYDSNRERPICRAYSDNCEQNAESTTPGQLIENISNIEGDCIPIEDNINCPLKYVNPTTNDNLERLMNVNKVQTRINDIGQRQPIIRISHLRSSNLSDCNCDLKNNFHYQDYCISNELMRPYLHYNSFWQPVRGGPSGHFGELKFVSFFCLRLHNGTSCNQMANLCVLSHYSADKHSPCSAFLLTQASDVAFRFGVNMDEQLRPMRPFLFFKKGKQTMDLLQQPVGNSSDYSLNHKNLLHIFSTHYELDGTLKRRGPFNLDHINLCGAYSLEFSQREIKFGRYSKPITCSLSLENIIDLAVLGWKSDFLSLFLNFTSIMAPHKVFLHAIPILVENLTPENQVNPSIPVASFKYMKVSYTFQRNQPSEWLLVKRFQMINAHSRYHLGHQKPSYEDAHKLQLYRSLRFVTKFELHYKIHAENRISTPMVRLRYQHIEIHPNTTLNERFTFTMAVTFAIAKQEETHNSSRHNLLNETVLPMALLIAITISLLRAHNYRKRRRSTILTSVAERPQPVPMDLCDFRTVLEFLVQLCSNVSHVLLMCFLLHVIYDALKFLTQNEVTVTMPLIKDDGTTLRTLIYAALLLKLIFYCIHLWRCTHFDLFFIDWERPKSYDNNHFNLKNNLETSSVCSSVRTFVSESNVSAWRIFFTANEWIRLSRKRKTSVFVQGLGLLFVYKTLKLSNVIQEDVILQIFFIVITYSGIYLVQLIFHVIYTNYMTGNPLKKFIDLCSWANVSVFILQEPSFGYYIHGRSPHGFADTDMSSMIMQLQRESQSMCGRRGLLSDSDHQTYTILPPINLRTYFQRLLIPFQRSFSISQAHFQKETTSLCISSGVDGNLERTFVAYSSINRFFCAFIDHAIKDMDYIIKEKTFLERLLDCEFENYLTENKGTFYIDNANSFSQLFLYGNEFHTLVIEFLLLLAIYMWTENLILALTMVCFFNMLIQRAFSTLMRSNVSKKTLIDQRFLL